MLRKDVELRDYVFLFWENKKTIIYVLVASLCLALVLVLFGPKRYTKQVFLKMGKVLRYEESQFKVKPIESPISVAEQLVNMHNMKTANAIQAANIVAIKLYGFSHERIKEQEKLIDTTVIQPHQKEFDRINETALQFVKNIEERIENINNEINSIKKSSAGKNEAILQLNANGKSILLERYDKLYELQELKTALKSYFDKNLIHSSYIINPNEQVEKDFKWIVAIFALCLILGIASSLLYVMSKEMKRLEKENN